MAGYHRGDLERITGRKQVVLLTYHQDWMGMQRWPQWLTHFRQQLDAGATSVSAISECDAKVGLLDEG